MSNPNQPPQDPQLTPEQEGDLASFEYSLAHDVHGNPVHPDSGDGAIIDAAANDLWNYQNLLNYARNEDALPIDPDLHKRLQATRARMPDAIASRGAANLDYVDWLNEKLDNEPLDSDTIQAVQEATAGIPNRMGDRVADNVSFLDDLHVARHDPAREQLTRDLAERGIDRAPDAVAQRLADDPLRHEQEVARLAGGHGSPEVQRLVRSVLDRNVDPRGWPYAPERTDNPDYDPNFDGLLNELISAADMAASDMAPTAEWEQRRNELAQRLFDALKADGDQVVHVQATINLFEDHVRGASNSSQEADTALDKAREKLVDARHSSANHDPAYDNAALRPPKGVQEIEPMPVGHRVPDKPDHLKHEYGTDAKRHWIEQVQAPLLRANAPLTRRGKAQMEKYIHDYTDALVETDRAANYAGMAASKAETGDYGAIKQNQMLNYETKKLESFNEIIARVEQLSLLEDPNSIHQLSQQANPDVIQGKFDPLEDAADVEVFQQRLNDALMDWRQYNGPATAHEAYAQVHRTRAYLKHVETVLEGMSPYNRHYGRLLTIHNNLRPIHNVAAHQMMVLRWEIASEKGFDYENRYPVRYTHDMGVYQRDGSGIVYYPDGSTRNGSGPRLDAHGEIWTPPAPEPAAQPRNWKDKILRRNPGTPPPAPITGNRAELSASYVDAANTAFIEPTDRNRETAARHASALQQRAGTEIAQVRQREVDAAREQARADAEQDARDAATAAGNAYDADAAAAGINARAAQAARDARANHRPAPDRLRDYHFATYWTYYHGFTPGEPQDPSGPHMLESGLIRLPNHHLMDRDSDWVIGPNGGLQEVDGRGNIVNEYNPDGTPV